MKSKHLLSGVALLAISTSWLFTACSKNYSADVSADRQAVNLYMTDGPGVYDKVFLDITSVKVLVDTSKDTRKHDNCDWDDFGKRNHKPDSAFVWEDLNVHAGVYDLLSLRNGVDTLLANANIKAGSIRLIRIDLGTRNSLVKDSITYPITIPAGAPSYILVKLRGDEWEHFAGNAYRLWLDFDVARSIVQVGTTFYLKPFIHAFIVNKTGSVYGSVLPRDAWPEIVSVYNSTDTAYAITNRDGMFKIRGLKDGTYSALYHASNGYKDTTISNIKISNANSVSVGTVTLHK